MSFEADELELIAGFRHGETLGDPIAIRIDNSEWRKWRTAMAPGPVTSEELAGQARAAALTRPRPGHADLAGMQKYDFDEARPVLERASARENGTPDRTDSRADRRIPIPRRHAGAGTQTERHHHDDRTDCKSLDRFHRITSLEYRV